MARALNALSDIGVTFHHNLLPLSHSAQKTESAEPIAEKTNLMRAMWATGSHGEWMMELQYGELGERLRKLRIRAGITQAALASRVGVPYQTLQKWEKGQR